MADPTPGPGEVRIRVAASGIPVTQKSADRFGGAQVIGSIRNAAEEDTARRAGAHHVVVNDAGLIGRVRAIAPDGVDHIVEVAFAANIERDIELLKSGGTLATYATNDALPTIPFWPMIFKNIQLNFLGSDDFPMTAKIAAARDLNGALVAGWSGFVIGERIPLAEIARAHELTDHPTHPGRVVLMIE